MSTSITTEAILSAQNITKRFGAQPLLDNISLTLHEGERTGLIGRNGCGKSTLLKILAGIEMPDHGLVTRRQNLNVVLLQQECPLDKTWTVGQALDDASVAIHALIDRYQHLGEQLASSPHDSPEHAQYAAEHHRVHAELDACHAWELDENIKRISVALNLPAADQPLATLSGGELRRVDLATCLLQRPDVLLLDEPTNHIDTTSVEWIERFLSVYEGTCLLVTHDRYFLDRVVNRTVELENQRIYSFPGNYHSFLEYKARVESAEAKAENSRQALLRRELAWLRQGAKARTSKDKHRIQQYYELEGQGAPAIPSDITFEIPQPQRLAKRILEFSGVGFRFGDRPLFNDLSLILQKGMRLGLVGPNGCGKTTLLEILMGQREATRGKVFIGDSVQFLYVDQAHKDVDPTQSILKYATDGAKHWDVNGRRLYIPAYLQRYLFDTDSVEMPMSNLSGGERNRIHLAKSFLRGGNILILDEPTNDLDLPTLRVLEETILGFDGCAIVVSHDRYFLNRICTHLLVFEEDAKILNITGNYDDYLRYKKLAPKEIDTAEKSKPARVRTAPPSRGLSFKEKKALAAMEATIEAAEIAVAELEAQINAPGFYQQDHQSTKSALGKLEQAKRHVADLYARWEDLESRK